MPKPRSLPAVPEGWFWHESSQVKEASNYLATPQLTLEGPPDKRNYTHASIGAPKVSSKANAILYSCTLKKLSACCGVGHAVHFLYPSKPEVDKMELMLQAIEEQNCVASRNLSLLTLVERNAWAPPAIEAMTKRGWSRAFGFRNMVWHRDDPKNNVQLWYKDCTPLFNQMEAEDRASTRRF